MSSRKNIIKQFTLVKDQSIANSFTSMPVHVPYLDNVGIQIVTADVTSNSGTFFIEATIDEQNWEPLTLSPAIPPLTGTNVNILVNLNQLPFTAIRVRFQGSSLSNGTCTITVSAKEV